MSLERRLRDGLSGVAAVVDSDVERHLDQALGRGRRRVRTRQALVRAAAVAIVVVGVVGAVQLGGGEGDQRVATDPGPIDARASRPEPLAGRYEASVDGAEDVGLVDGLWVAAFGQDGTILLEAPPTYTGTRSGLYRVTEDVLETDVFGSDLCSGFDPGRYRWERSSGSLTLATVADGCAPRERLLTSERWSVVAGG